MKRILLLMILSCMAITGFAQGTYYWVGGATATTLGGTNWSLTPGGAAVSRSNTADVLIFDNVTVAFTIGGTTIGKLQLQNGADVSFTRNASSGTTTLALSNGTSSALEVTGNSKLRLVDGIGGSFVLSVAATSTATFNNSELYILGAIGAQRLQVPTTGTCTFSNNSKCYVNVMNQYPLSATSTSGVKSVIFNSGTSLIYQGGRSPFGDASTGYVADMRSGSNYILEANNSVAGLFNGKNFGNVLVRNNAAITLSENFLGVENLTIENGASLLLNATGPSPVSGNVLNNGTLGVNGVGSCNLMMLGTTAQSISGSGTFNLGALSVANDANVTLNSSINLGGALISYIYGALDLQGNQIIGNGVSANTGRVQFRAAVNTFTNAATVVDGSNVINFVNVADYNTLDVAPGHLITGPQIQPNTYVISTSSTGVITLSKPATGNGSAIAVIGNSPTLKIANTNGIDGGFNINANGSLTLSTGTNVIFNSSTLTPFSTVTGNTLGNVTFNAAARTNKNITINGKLTLNNAILTVREGDNLSLSSASINTGTFNASSYIVTNAVGGSTGLVKIADVSASTLVPVGAVGHYTPVTLNPTSISNFEINVFQGATADATSNGTALTAAQKLRMVDAVWNINRTSGTGNVDVTLGWDNALEGGSFAGFGNAQIGIAAYTSGAYGTFMGTGNAAANTATITTSTFSPFVVGEANTTLPLRLLSFTAKESLNSVKLAWQTTDEVNLKEYVLQHRSANGFEKIYTVVANNKAGIFNYDYTHLNPTEGINYYRLVGIDQDGTEHPSEVKSVRIALGNAVAVYPNPVTQNNISVAGTVNGDVIKIINIQGQVMLTKPVSGNQLQEINVQNIQAGTYILSIENAGKVTSTKKVIKI